MTSESLTYFKVNLWDWISGTIDKINPDCTNTEWHEAWYKTYKELCGESHNSGTKSCPKVATYCLYKLGRIKGSNIPFKPLSYREIFAEYGSNCLYAIIAHDILKVDPSLSLNDLWQKVRNKYKKEAGKDAAVSNQSAMTVTFKLFQNQLLIK